MKNLLFVILFASVAVIGIAQTKHEKPVSTDATRNVPLEGVLTNGAIPNMHAFTPEGEAIDIKDLCKGKYTVLSAGCLTCPLFHQNYPEIEAAYADYKDKGVQFFYFYKSLRHPELEGYVQAQKMSERLLQLKEARQKLGTKVPWIADTMDDNMRIGLRSGSWSVFLISPEGEVIYGSGRIDSQGLRQALSKAVGESASITNSKDLGLPRIGRNEKLKNEDSQLGVKRPDGLKIATIVPTKPEETYYVKLRVEAEPALLETGTGRLFLGFYPDPIHDAHWNNLVTPMKYKLTLPKGVIATPEEASAAKGPGDSDAQPRQFWVDVKSDQAFDEMSLQLDYYACTEDLCLPLTHEYIIEMKEDNSGSRTFNMNTGRSGKTKTSNSAEQRMKHLDSNHDGSVTFDEFFAQMQKRNSDVTQERALQQFNKINTNNDKLITLEELERAPQNKKGGEKPNSKR